MNTTFETKPIDNTPIKASDDDLRVFLLWVNDILTFYGISEYKLLNDCGFNLNFLAMCRNQLKGKAKRRTKISLWLLMVISVKYPYDLGMFKYLPLLGASPLSNESKSIDSVLTKPRNGKRTKKAPHELTQEA